MRNPALFREFLPRVKDVASRLARLMPRTEETVTLRSLAEFGVVCFTEGVVDFLFDMFGDGDDPDRVAPLV